jgi:hypothetical protein
MGESSVELSLESAELRVEWDYDSSQSPTYWIWLMFTTPGEPWLKLTTEEAVDLRDALDAQLRAGGEI